MAAVEIQKRAGDVLRAADGREGLAQALHRVWQVAIVVTICTGLFHLINLVDPGRVALGPALLTPFRIAFAVSWMALAAELMLCRRRPSLDSADLLVAVLTLLFLLRGIFTPETFSIVFNWAITGAGAFFLVKYGVRDEHDLRLVVATISCAIVTIGIAGVVEYAVKTNPLFDAIQIDAVGTDTRVGASNQFYRVRSLVGHPGYVGAVLVSGAPLVALVFWRRRLLMAAFLAVIGTALLFTFSRGSWFLAAIFLIPVLFYRGRFWFKHNAKWLAPVLILPVIFITVDYLKREEVSIHLGGQPVAEGLSWTRARDGAYQVVSGEAEGVKPAKHFLYFNVDDGFFRNGDGPATVIVRYFDAGSGPVHIDYDSWNEAGEKSGAYTVSGVIDKTDTRHWTTAAFYLPDPRFDGRQNGGADFRIVDDDNQIVIDEVILQKGALKLPSVIAQQWRSRAGSFYTRANFFPMTWAVLKENPLGVGLFNCPGTNHHAIDSLPLTWIMEFGWPALLLLGLILWTIIREGRHAFRAKNGSAAALFLSLMLLLLHGGHLMILYDKPNLVLFGMLAAVYALIRPWRRQGALLQVSNRDFMI